MGIRLRSQNIPLTSSRTRYLEIFTGESLEKLGNQLKVAEENQKQFLARMLELKKSGETDSEEYADLSRKSKGLKL